MNSKQLALLSFKELILTSSKRIASMRPGELIWNIANKAQDLANEGFCAEAYTVMSILLVAIAGEPMTDDNTEIARRFIETVNEALTKEPQHESHH